MALGIVAIALAAGSQATTALTRNALRQSDVLLAQICAENELVKARLSHARCRASAMPACAATRPTSGFGVTVSCMPTPNPNFRRVDAQVCDGRLAGAAAVDRRGEILMTRASARGFTLVELLVALFAMALLAVMSWRGLDGMSARPGAEPRARPTRC